VEEYRDPGHAAGTFRSVLVVGISDTAEKRRVLEAAFARELEGRGVVARSALDVLGPGTPLDRDSLEPAVRRLGLESVLVAHVLGLREERVYNAPVYYQQEMVHGTSVYVYSPTVTATVMREGYYTTFRYYTLETNLYGAETGRLVWSGRSERLDPQSVEQVAADLATVTLDRLRAQRLLP
jgi:hypothetical protein